MNPANILLALQILETVWAQAGNIITQVKQAQASGTDLSDAVVGQMATQAGVDIDQLKSDAAAATAAGN